MKITIYQIIIVFWNIYGAQEKLYAFADLSSDDDLAVAVVKRLDAIGEELAPTYFEEEEAMMALTNGIKQTLTCSSEYPCARRKQ